MFLDYKFYEKLGKGSSGLVYKAEKLISNLTSNSPNLQQSCDFTNEGDITKTSFKSQKGDISMFIECAIKIIKLDKEKMFDRLKYEIAIMKMCRHDNIVLYYDTFKHMQ